MSEESILDHGYTSAEIDAPVAGEYALSDARANFTALVNQATEEGLRIVITRHGKPAAAIVPIRDLERLRDADKVAREGLRIAADTEGEVIDVDDEDEAQAAVSDKIVSEAVTVFVREVLQIPEVRERVLGASNAQLSPSSDDQENEVQPRRNIAQDSHV